MDIQHKKSVKGVIFDMDGTLTKPVIDFSLMRRLLGIPSGDVLDAIGRMSPRSQTKSFAVIDAMEREAEDKMELQDGVFDVFWFLRDEVNVPIALFTRNQRRSVATFMKVLETKSEGIFDESMFHAVYTREDLPWKPDPKNVFDFCGKVGPGVEGRDILFVGDGLDDILCGRMAKTHTFWLTNGKDQKEERDALLENLRRRSEDQRAEPSRFLSSMMHFRSLFIDYFGIAHNFKIR